MARRQLAGTDLGATQCRAARVDQWADALPAEPARAGAMARALRPRRWGRHDRRLLRQRGGTHRRARRNVAADRARQWRWAAAAAAEGAQPGVGPRCRLALQPAAAAPGERLSVD